MQQKKKRKKPTGNGSSLSVTRAAKHRLGTWAQHVQRRLPTVPSGHQGPWEHRAEQRPQTLTCHPHPALPARHARRKASAHGRATAHGRPLPTAGLCPADGPPGKPNAPRRRLLQVPTLACPMQHLGCTCAETVSPKPQLSSCPAESGAFGKGCSWGPVMMGVAPQTAPVGLPQATAPRRARARPPGACPRASST